MIPNFNHIDLRINAKAKYHDNGFKIENNLLFWYIPTLNDLAFLKEINLI